MTTPDTAPDLTTSAEQDAHDAATLKGRRRANTKAKRSVLAPVPTEDTPPPLPDAHPNMASALSRRAPTLMHPMDKRQPPVAESGGYLPSSQLREYVVAEFDAAEQIVPAGCRTAVTRSLWSQGQHVRRDVYQTYLELHPELVPVPVVTVELPPEDSDDEQAEDHGEQGSGEPATGAQPSV